jgi:hypothetical protein
MASIRQRLTGFFTRSIANATEGSLSEQLDPLVAQSKQATSGTSGNVAVNYEAQVLAIYQRYNNLMQYGCTITRSVIDWRATQIAGNGVNATSTDNATNAFVSDFIKNNELNGHRFWDWARDSEIEGKSLMVLKAERIDDEIVIKAKNLPWIRWNYQVDTAKHDAEQIESVTMQDNDKEKRISKDKFVYIRTAGASASKTVYHTNQTPPKIAPVLWYIDNIDKAMADLRCNNQLFAFPKLVAEAKDQISANGLRALLFGKSTKGQTKASLETDRGEFYIIDGKMYYAEPSGQAVASLTTEVNTIAKIISGATGMPVHHMGFVDLMSNRSTAEDLAEMVNASTMHEREAWKAGIKELLVKACNMHSKATGALYDTDTIEVTLPVVMMSQITQIANVYLPLEQSGIISKETVRERVPGVDPELEQERIDASKESNQNEAVEMADLINANIAKENAEQIEADNETDSEM